MIFSKKIGNLGEDFTKKEYLKKGYIILETNFRMTFGEIDLIFVDRKNKILVCVEVKTQSQNSSFSAINHFHKKKQILFRKISQFYFNDFIKRVGDDSWNLRLDLVIVVIGDLLTFNENSVSIEILEGVC